MRIAITHNFLDNIGGAEKVALTLARELKGDLYSTNVNQEMIRKMGYEEKVHSIGKVPRNAPFRQQLTLLRFRYVKFKQKYNCFIFGGDWSMSCGVKNKPNIWYAHSPIRGIWDLYEHTRNKILPWYQRPFFDVWVKYNRYLNKKYVKEVNILVCNSENVKKRIKKYLGRDARVIHPPIDTNKYEYKKNGDYWLAVNRLISHKRVELQLEAFSRLPNEKLIIVGSYEKAKQFTKYKNKIEKMLPKNVTIINHADDLKVKELYANCKGFITTSEEEDFGMTPIEAMASGKPVIAPAEGGYLETIIDKKTGRLIKNINVEKIVKAIIEINKNPQKYKLECQKQAKKFDTKVFVKKIKEEIEKLTNDN
ncbi:glycosyltransferase [Candidatus Woesearchaeota archaeon]|nr:glycosyltransferase [Candidatus Woesearchaeota archaeon]